MTKTKKRIIVLSVIAVILIIAFIAICLYICFFRNGANSFEMKADNDNSSYQSNEYNYSSAGLFCNRHLSFNNGKLIASNRDCNNITIYTPDRIESFSAPKNSQMVDNKLFYSQENNLYCKNINTNTTETIDTDCDIFVISNKYVAYLKQSKIYISELNGFKTIGTIELSKDIYYFTIIEDSLYLIESVPYDSSTSTEYTFSKYNLNTLALEKSISKPFVDTLKYVTVCNDRFYFYYDETNSIYGLSLDDEDTIVISYDNVVDIASNNHDVYFVSEKTEYSIVRTTVDCESNGIWKIDGENSGLSKISDKCTFDNILATKNYVYGYTIAYSLPRGMDTMFAIGFSIEQIPIK